MNDFNFNPFDHDVEEFQQLEVAKTPASDKEEDEVKEKNFSINNKYLYATYSQCSLRVKEEFEANLKSILPINAQYFGGRELHEDGGVHYHVVIYFPNKAHWQDGRKQMTVPGNTCTSINLSPVKKRQSLELFLSNTQDYCAKDGDTFGTRIEAEKKGSVEAKRKFNNVLEATSRDEAVKRIKTEYNEKFIFCHSNVLSYLKHEYVDSIDRAEYVHDVIEFDKPFRSIPILDKFVETMITNPTHGRKSSLLLIGRGGEGKTGWARSLGRHIYLDTRWTPTVLDQPGDYIVLDDIHDRFPEWKVILGAQRTLTAKIMRKDPVTVKWGKACIWLANPDNDPRKWGPEVRSYIERMCTVYELGEDESMY